MAILQVALNIPDENFNQMLESLSALNVLLQPPGVSLYRLADSVAKGQPINIFSTGCIRDISPSAVISDGWDTFYLARWVKDHPGSTLTSVELDPVAIESCQTLLRKYGLNEYATLIPGDSIDTMETWDRPVDMFVLDSCDGLRHGLLEFQSALAYNPKMIVMDDWDTKVIMAADYATSVGIPYTRVDRYTVFQIPRQGE